MTKEFNWDNAPTICEFNGYRGVLGPETKEENTMTFTKNKTAALRELNNSRHLPNQNVQLSETVSIERKGEGVYSLSIFNGFSGEGMNFRANYHLARTGTFAQCWAEFIKNWTE